MSLKKVKFSEESKQMLVERREREIASRLALDISRETQYLYVYVRQKSQSFSYEKP